MNQTNNQQPAFETECKIIFKGHIRTTVEYSRRAINGKEYGHMNDSQTYERMDLKAIAKFMKSKNLTIKDVRLIKQVKNMNTMLGRIRELKEELALIA